MACAQSQHQGARPEQQQQQGRRALASAWKPRLLNCTVRLDTKGKGVCLLNSTTARVPSTRGPAYTCSTGQLALLCPRAACVLADQDAHLQGALFPDEVACYAQGVLVDCNQLLSGQDAQRLQHRVHTQQLRHSDRSSARWGPPLGQSRAGLR